MPGGHGWSRVIIGCFEFDSRGDFEFDSRVEQKGPRLTRMNSEEFCPQLCFGIREICIVTGHQVPGGHSFRGGGDKARSSQRVLKGGVLSQGGGGGGGAKK